jgi:hypothetical protein
MLVEFGVEEMIKVHAGFILPRRGVRKRRPAARFAGTRGVSV